MVTLWRKDGAGTVQSDPEVIQSDPERSKTDTNLLESESNQGGQGDRNFYTRFYVPEKCV